MPLKFVKVYKKIVNYFKYLQTAPKMVKKSVFLKLNANLYKENFQKRKKKEENYWIRLMSFKIFLKQVDLLIGFSNFKTIITLLIV